MKTLWKHAAELVIKHNKKIKNVARDYSVSPSTIRRWMDKYTEEQIARDKATEVVRKEGRYHGEGNQGHNYSAMYDGHTFYSDCTCKLAEKIADYIGGNVKADISNASA